MIIRPLIRVFYLTTKNNTLLSLDDSWILELAAQLGFKSKYKLGKHIDIQITVKEI